MLDIEQFETKIGKKSRLLGLDPGRKRIGIAICDENKIVATPYTTIIKNKFSDLLNALNKIINENNIDFNNGIRATLVIDNQTINISIPKDEVDKLLNDSDNAQFDSENVSNNEQITEIKDIQWLTKTEALNKCRDYHVSRKDLIIKIFDFIEITKKEEYSLIS